MQTNSSTLVFPCWWIFRVLCVILRAWNRLSVLELDVIGLGLPINLFCFSGNFLKRAIWKTFLVWKCTLKGKRLWWRGSRITVGCILCWETTSWGRLGPRVYHLNYPLHTSRQTACRVWFKGKDLLRLVWTHNRGSMESRLLVAAFFLYHKITRLWIPSEEQEKHSFQIHPIGGSSQIGTFRARQPRSARAELGLITVPVYKRTKRSFWDQSYILTVVSFRTRVYVKLIRRIRIFRIASSIGVNRNITTLMHPPNYERNLTNNTCSNLASSAIIPFMVKTAKSHFVA